MYKPLFLMIPNFRIRPHIKEKLDNLDLSGQQFYKSLGELQWINSILYQHGQLTKIVPKVIKKIPKNDLPNY